MLKASLSEVVAMIVLLFLRNIDINIVILIKLQVFRKFCLIFFVIVFPDTIASLQLTVCGQWLINEDGVIIT